MNTDDINAESFTKAIYEEFSGSERPLTVGDAAEILGLMAAQHEANLAMFQLMLRIDPDSVFTTEMREAKDAIQFTGKTFHRAIMHLLHLKNSWEANDE